MNQKEWLESMQKFKANEADLSRDADLSIAVMNLISIEEHLEFSFSKTQDKKYLQMLESVREMRKDLLKKLVRSPKAEEWCISKHLLAASMRLFEVGTKELDSGQENEAAEFFNLGYELHSLFFGLNLGMINQDTFKGLATESTQKLAAESEPKTRKGFNQRLGEIIQKIVNCCKE